MNNIELHLPYIREAFKWSREDMFQALEEAQSFIEYNTEKNELKIDFQAGVYAPSVTLKEWEKEGKYHRYDIAVKGDFFLNQDSEEEVTFKYCDEIPESEASKYKTLDTETPENFTKRSSWANFLFDKIAKQFSSDHRANNLPAAAREELFQQFSVKNFEQMTEKTMEQVMFSLYKSRFFEMDYSEALDDRISGNPVYTENCVTNRYGVSESSTLAFDKVVFKDPAVEVALEASRPENSPYNRDFNTPGPFEKAMKTIAVKAFIRTCLVEVLLKVLLKF